MFKENSDIYNYFVSTKVAVEYAKNEGILKKFKKVMPDLCINTAGMEAKERTSLYMQISNAYKSLFDGEDSVYLYRTSSLPARKQICDLIYELSKKVGKKGEYTGIVVVAVNKEFVTMSTDYEVFLEFLKEQKEVMGWRIIYDIEEKSEIVQKEVMRNVFVEYVEVAAEDIKKELVSESIKNMYGIRLPTRFEKHVDKYGKELRKQDGYSETVENVLIQKLAYNGLILAAGRNVLKKNFDTEVITANVDADLFKKNSVKKHIGFVVE